MLRKQLHKWFNWRIVSTIQPPKPTQKPQVRSTVVSAQFILAVKAWDSHLYDNIRVIQDKP